MMGRLKGKTALVTGGTTGIDMATAKLFLQEGARVAIVGCDGARVEEAAAALGPDAIALRADVSSRPDMAAVATRLKAEFGKLDVVLANAGIAQPMGFSDVDDNNIDAQMAVNFKGAIYTVQSMLALLNNPSSVILTSTAMVDKGIAGMSVYAASKAAGTLAGADLVGRTARARRARERHQPRPDRYADPMESLACPPKQSKNGRDSCWPRCQRRALPGPMKWPGRCCFLPARILLICWEKTYGLTPAW
jgi:hypothetical protein